jgi:hypothetical protein
MELPRFSGRLIGGFGVHIVASDFDPLDDNDWITVYWQDNPERRTEVSATLFASHAVVR